jgi:hypothetical protein
LRASWKSFSKFAAGLACLGLLLAPGSRTLGSGGSDCEDLPCGSFFAPEIIQSPHEVPFFLADNTFYGASGAKPRDPSEDMEAVNLEEWNNYYGRAIPKMQLSFLLYKMPRENVDDLSISLSGKEVILSPEAKALNAAFAKYRRKDRVMKSLDYLSLAKRVEPIATRHASDGWQEKSVPPVDPESVRELIAMAAQRIPQADKFLAQRYRFQVIRLMYYSGQYTAAQDYFDQYRGGFTEENSSKYRFMHIAAGAYYKDKKYGEANYLFSLCFDKFLPLKRSSYFSFHPMEEPDWNETLSLAKDNHEREVLWQLLGIYADGMAAIDKIYSMNPKSALLPLLLVREVNKAEHDWSANQEKLLLGLTYGGGPKSDPEVVGPRRLARLKAIADAGNVYKPYIWQLSVGHLSAVSGDSKTAEPYIERARKSMPNVPELRDQARLSLLFARVRAIQSIDPKAEPYLAEEYEWLRNDKNVQKITGFRSVNVNDWTLRRLSDVYLKDGDTIRSMMLADSPQNDIYRTLRGIDSILAFMGNPSDAFDQFLVKNYSYSPEQLHELRGLLLLYAGDLPGAVEELKIAGPLQQELTADPFLIHIKDCHDCDFLAPHTKYTKLSFTERMLSLSGQAQGQGDAAATASFELANGFYNMSYYGNGRAIYDTEHGNLRPYSIEYPFVRPRARIQRDEPATNMNLAEKYYLRAADLSSSKEFKAKAIFMAAKTEQNRFYSTNPDKGARPPRMYFKLLEDSYADTAYYQEILGECEDFRTYVRK